MDLEKMIKNIASTSWIEKVEGKWELEISYNRGEYRYRNVYTQSNFVFIMGCFRITVIDKNLDINDAKNNMIVGYTNRLRIEYDTCSLKIKWKENRGENYTDEYPYHPHIDITVDDDKKKVVFKNIILEIEKI